MTRRITKSLGLLAALAFVATASPPAFAKNALAYKSCMDRCGRHDPDSTAFDRCADFCKCVHWDGKGNVHCTIKSTTDHPSASIEAPRANRSPRGPSRQGAVRGAGVKR